MAITISIGWNAFSALNSQVATIGAPPDSPQIIFDTDSGGDADDLGAPAMLHHIAAAMTHVPAE